MNREPRLPLRDKSNDAAVRQDETAATKSPVARGFLPRREKEATTRSPHKAAASLVASTATAKHSPISSTTAAITGDSGRRPLPSETAAPSFSSRGEVEYPTTSGVVSRQSAVTQSQYKYSLGVCNDGGSVAGAAAAFALAHSTFNNHAENISHNLSRPSSTSSLLSSTRSGRRDHDHHQDGISQQQEHREQNPCHDQFSNAYSANSNTDDNKNSSNDGVAGEKCEAATTIGATGTKPYRPYTLALPPVACTLVAFEPGSLGLELEAVVVKPGTRGEGQEEGQGDTQGQRLGCRVFRVTPGGQAARHGSVHPGDALVVLDG